MEKAKVVFMNALAYARSCTVFLFLLFVYILREFTSVVGIKPTKKGKNLGRFSMRKVFPTVLRSYKLDANKKAALGQPAPDAELWNLDSETKCRLLDFAKPNRFLVLNFGSCT